MKITDCKKKAMEDVEWKQEKLRKDICSHNDSRQAIAHKAGIRPETLTDFTSGKHDLSDTNFLAVAFALGKNHADYHPPK